MTARARYPLAGALELVEIGQQLRAQRHRREHPDATDDEIAVVVDAWMHDRRGAPTGDAEGRSVSLPRSP